MGFTGRLHKALYGYYPELLLADRIYLTRENRKYLKNRGIRHSGKPLGRPTELPRHEKQKRKKEQNKCSEIEWKFGQAKSKYGLDDILTRRKDTSYACIGLILLAINLIKLSGAVFVSFFSCCISLWHAQFYRHPKIDSIGFATGREWRLKESFALAS